MSGKGPSFLPKLFIAILIFAFTLWWISPTQCPEGIPITTISTISTISHDNNVNTPLVNLTDFPDTNSLPFLGAQFETCKRPTIVTASNALYFPSLQNLAGSLLRSQATSYRVKLTIVDLGMSNDQRKTIGTWCNAELVALNKDYRSAANDFESQAWIPLAIDQIINSNDDVCILYLDPRTEVRSPLLPIFQDLEMDGYWFVHTGGEISMSWLGKDDQSVMPEISTTAFGISGKGLAFSGVIGEWKHCMLESNCKYKHLRFDPKNIFNGIIYLNFKQVHSNHFQTDLVIHKETKFAVKQENDIDANTVFFLRPAVGQYPFAGYAVGNCATSVYTKPVLSAGDKEPVSAPPKQLKQGSFVVMAANQVVKYCFYIPVSALIWKEKYGYDGIILLIGEEHKWKTEPHLKIITKYLDIFGISYVYHINTTDTYSITLSQLTRIFAAYLPELDITDDSFMITSDADLWPINPNLYKITETGKEMLLLNSACCGGFTHKDKYYTMFPMGHIGMSKKTWKEVMNIPEERLKLPFVDMVLAEGTDFFGMDHLQNVQHGGKGWFNDQMMISVKIGDWPGFPSKAQREAPKAFNRIDRAGWPSQFTEKSVLSARDAHLLHGLDNWNRVAEVLRYLIPADKFKLANDYATEFITAHPAPN